MREEEERILSTRMQESTHVMTETDEQRRQSTQESVKLLMQTQVKKEITNNLICQKYNQQKHRRQQVHLNNNHKGKVNRLKLTNTKQTIRSNYPLSPRKLHKQKDGKATLMSHKIYFNPKFTRRYKNEHCILINRTIYQNGNLTIANIYAPNLESLDSIK